MRWNLPDKIFFGYGACHILAGAFVQENIDPTFKPYWIKPPRHPGNHIFVSDGRIAFDYHGYSHRDRLLAHHRKVWTHQHPDWDADVEPVNFNLLNTVELNARNMRGVDQYLHDPLPRALKFLSKYDHVIQAQKRA